MKTQIFTLLFLIGILSTQVGLAMPTFTAENKLQETEALNVFPNPIKDKGTLQIDIEKNTVAKIEFYDLSGKKVKEIKEIPLSKGSNNVDFFVNDFKEGYYFCKVSTDQWVKTKRILIRR